MKISIKKVTSSEENVSLRSISYDIYVDGEYTVSFDDVMDAYDYKEALIDEDSPLIIREEDDKC